jgi:hypothetical protein
MGKYIVYIHDGGETYCAAHLPMSAQGEVEAHPQRREHWTPRGTWEGFTADETKRFDLSCEECDKS